MVYFISGHREISLEEFNRYYIPALKQALKDPTSKFVVGDYWGVDRLAQTWLSVNIPEHMHNHKVTVYHMFDEPRVLESRYFRTIGGFKDDISRDSAMTKVSDIDIAFIKPKKWTSGTAQNILRRFEMGTDLLKNKNQNRKEVIDRIKDDYKNDCLCMGEILAYFRADGLTIEDAHEIYEELKSWVGEDDFRE